MVDKPNSCLRLVRLDDLPFTRLAPNFSMVGQHLVTGRRPRGRPTRRARRSHVRRDRARPSRSAPSLRRLLLERISHRLELEPLLLDLPEEVLLVVLAQLLLLVLRVKQPIDAFDFALDRLDALDGFLHLVDQAALHRFGEFDFANPLRDLDARAHGSPACLAILALVARRGALRRFVQLILQFLGD